MHCVVWYSLLQSIVWYSSLLCCVQQSQQRGDSGPSSLQQGDTGPLCGPHNAALFPLASGLGPLCPAGYKKVAGLYGNLIMLLVPCRLWLDGLGNMALSSHARMDERQCTVTEQHTLTHTHTHTHTVGHRRCPPPPHRTPGMVRTVVLHFTIIYILLYIYYKCNIDRFSCYMRVFVCFCEWLWSCTCSRVNSVLSIFLRDLTADWSGLITLVTGVFQNKCSDKNPLIPNDWFLSRYGVELLNEHI